MKFGSKMLNTHYSAESCPVYGLLNIVLRVSQMVGIAPLKFTKKNGVWHISIAPALCIANYVITTILNAGATAGLVFDLTAPSAQAVRTRSTTRKFVWITDFAIVMLTASLAGYRSPTRMRETIAALTRIQKLNLSPQENVTSTQKSSIAFMICLLLTVSLLASDYKDFMDDVIASNKQLMAASLYICYYYSYLMLIFVEMQYVFSALEVSKSMKYVSNLLDELSHLLKLRNDSFDDVILDNKIRVLPSNSVNMAIDLLATRPIDQGFLVVSTPKSVKESISQIASKYSVICDVVRQLDHSYGAEILSLLLSFLLHLVITPYNLIVNLYHNQVVDIPVATMQILWCGLHFACTLAVTEPSYRIAREVERITVITSHMIIKSTDEFVSSELDKFARYLLLNKVAYSPLGICTLGRSVVASILGSVATYIVIIIQFQSSEY